jgi:hypothetical protein
MVLRNVPSTATLEEQRVEINELAADVNALTTSDVTFASDVTFDGIATFNSSPTFSDNIVANFGDDADLKIYYDGSVGVETSFIDSDALQIRSESDTSELYATFLKDGPVELYYDGAKKFGTNLTGATVLGDLEINDEIHSASGEITLKVADQITPGNMITAAIFGGSIYAPYGFDTYNIANFPGGGISETSTDAGFSVGSNGQIYIASNGGNALWKGRQVGTAGITSEIDAPGNATFAGTVKSGALDLSNTSAAGIEVRSTGEILLQRPSDQGTSSLIDGRLGNTQKFNILGDGTATFAGVLTAGQRLVVNQNGTKSGTEDTFLNYAGDGSTVTASFTADGDAAFRSTITSGAADRRGQFLATCPSTVTASAADAFVATYDSTTVLQVKYNGDINLNGIIQTNTKSAGNIELDSTGAFTSSPLKLNAITGNIESNNPNGDTSLSIGDPTNAEGRLILTSKLNTVEIHSRSNHPIEFLFNTTTKASIGIDGTISDSIGPLRKLGSNTLSGAYTLVASDAGKYVAQSSNSAAVTVPNGIFAAGDMVTIVNLTATNINIVQGSGLDLNFTADGTTGTRTLAQKGVCTILFVSSGTSFISGSGLS